MFTQGCGADVNPGFYKGNDIDYLRDAEPLGNLLGLSTLRALRKIRTRGEGPLKLINETLELPRADLEHLIVEMEQEQRSLLQSLTLSLYVPHYEGQDISEGDQFQSEELPHPVREVPPSSPSIHPTTRIGICTKR